MTCYTTTPDTHQWYTINTNEITDSHDIVICNNATINMVQLPPVEPHEANVIAIFARLAPQNSQTDVVHITNGQLITNNPNTNKHNTLSNK